MHAHTPLQVKPSQPCHRMLLHTEIIFHKEAVELPAVEEVQVTCRPAIERLHVFSAKRTISSETVPIKRRRSPKDTVEPVQDQVTEPHTMPRCHRMDGPSTQSYNAIDAKDVTTARKNARRSSTTPRLPRPKPTSENTASGTSGKSKTRIETD